MATITLSYDARNLIAKKTIAYILSLGVFKNISKTAVDISLEEAKKGQINKYKNVDDLFDKVLS